MKPVKHYYKEQQSLDYPHLHVMIIMWLAVLCRKLLNVIWR